MKNNKTLNMTSGNPTRLLILFAIPMLIGNLFQQAYNLADSIIVGKYVGTAGLSAVSQSSQILNFATMVCLGFSNGGQVLTSQALGAGKKREMHENLGHIYN